QHAGRKVRDIEAQCTQGIAEQQVLLEAPAAPAVTYQLALDRLRIEAHAPAKEGVEVLEGDGQCMPQHQRAQHLESGLARAGVADAPQVAFQIQNPPAYSTVTLLARLRG